MDSTPASAHDAFHEQELRIALVMNGGVSLAVWIGGVAQEINRLVRRESVYGRLCQALWLRPRVDIVSGTSAGGINGALLALAMSQGKPLDPLRGIWLAKGDIVRLLRDASQDDPPSLLDGGYFYAAMADGFRQVQRQAGKGLQPPAEVPIELTLTTTVLAGEVRDFPDDLGTVIRDVSHRGLIKFRRGPDTPEDHFAEADIVAKLAAAARATASFPGAFEPFYLPGRDERRKAGGVPVPCLAGHTDFNKDWPAGRYVVDGGVLDNNPLESAIDAIFRQRAEGEVRRVLAYVVPDPGYIPDPPPQDPEQVPSLLGTSLAALVNIPRVESVSEQLRAIAEHNRRVASQRDTRLLVARSLDWEGADRIAESVFPGYRLRRAQSAADYIALALVEGAAGQGQALGRRARQRIVDALLEFPRLPWLPDDFAYAEAAGEWRWGLYTLKNVMTMVLDLLRRGVGLVPARRSEFAEPAWQGLVQARRKAYDLVAELDRLRQLDGGHWVGRGRALAARLRALESGAGDNGLQDLLSAEVTTWVRRFDADAEDGGSAPRPFAALAGEIGTLFGAVLPLLRQVLALGAPRRASDEYAELSTLLDFLDRPDAEGRAPAPWRRPLTLEVVHYAFGAETTQDQYLELVQFSANAASPLGGPEGLEQKLAGVQVAHFGAFYKASWRVNDWMFGRLDGAERLVRILLDPGRLARLFGYAGEPVPTGAATALAHLREAALGGLPEAAGDAAFLQGRWAARESALRAELAFLDRDDGLPGQLPECVAMLLERLHLEILRQELPALADAVGDDELDGADPSGNGPKFLKRFRAALFPPGAPPAPLAGAPALSAEQLLELFRGARVGEEKIMQEAGSDRFTALATRAAAVAVSALSGKGSGLKWLRGVFAAVRTPLVVLDILVRALLKRGRSRVFLSLYAMAMAASAALLLAVPFADARLHAVVAWAAGGILVLGLALPVRRHPRLLLGLALLVGLAVLVWKGVPLVRAWLG
ncbi:patatin-like protein [Parasulfuritortus cantonensis]|uniref:Patatin-like protein n=1 Tax=Parasulfuritortus cantonensis TaxID=2528202 RepID=A0A4R1B923_9PROT|nr:patatin-like protein [Parasulfuritortus cantonensis]TCJ12989.1 patatin-like protein [Parasulfuritortus cantonensis]